MRKKVKHMGKIIIPLIAVIALVVLGVYLVPRGLNQTEPRQARYPSPDPADPSAVVDGFYKWYMEQPGNPLTSGAYKLNPALASDLKQSVDELLNQNTPGGFDPFLCAQDKPKQIMVGQAYIDGPDATVNVEQTFDTGKRVIPVQLNKLGDNWEITTILCDQVKLQQGLGSGPQTIIVYYSNSRRSGNDQACEVVYGTERNLSGTGSPTEEALRELFKGPTAAEAKQGYSSIFSETTRDILISVKTVESKAYVNLKDIRPIIPNASSSCGSAQFLSSVGETLKHDRQITAVYYAINGNPQLFYDWIQIGCDVKTNNCDPAPFN
jgi:hypothetical protein